MNRQELIDAIEAIRKSPEADAKSDEIDDILTEFGASEDDSDPEEGFYAGMYTNDIRMAYEDIRKLLYDDYVNVYAKVESGWQLLFENIPEEQAQAIWQAGFATGENKFSIETKRGRGIVERNKRALGIKSSTIVKASRKCIQADNDYLSDEDKEILRRADTSGWAAMQTQHTQDEIDKAGSYDKYIAKERGSRIKASKYYEDADTYVVSIWHEVEGMRGGLPSAAQEIFEIVADSPDEALERAKMQWKGPIDRIEIIDVNPEDTEEDVPFNAATTICADTNEEWAEYLTKKLKLDDYYSETLLHDLNNGRADEWLDSVPEKDKADFAADFNIDYGPISFKQWVAREYGEDFDLSGISDAEYYDLEDTYREEIPAERREKRYR